MTNDGILNAMIGDSIIVIYKTSEYLGDNSTTYSVDVTDIETFESDTEVFETAQEAIGFA